MAWLPLILFFAFTLNNAESRAVYKPELPKLKSQASMTTLELIRDWGNLFHLNNGLKNIKDIKLITYCYRVSG
jgi:hypothetical protein